MTRNELNRLNDLSRLKNHRADLKALYADLEKAENGTWFIGEGKWRRPSDDDDLDQLFHFIFEVEAVIASISAR